jgi:hypothetical protein
MANHNRVLGQARIKYDGTTLDTDGEATLDIGGTTREAVTGDYEAGAFREATAPSKLECSILLKSGVRLTDLRRIDNATVTFEADTGQTYIIRNAYVAEAITLSGSDGKAKLVFQGPPAEEL